MSAPSRAASAARALVLCIAAVLAGAAIQAAEDAVRLVGGVVRGPADAAGLTEALTRSPELLDAEGGAALVKLAGPAPAAWSQAAEKAGIRLVAALGPDAYLAWLPAGVAPTLRALPGFSWHAPYHPGLRIDPALLALGERAGSGETATRALPITIHLFAHADARQVAARAASLGLRVSAVQDGSMARGLVAFERPGRVVILASEADVVRVRETIAAWPETLWLGRRPQYRLLNDASAWVGQAGLSRPGETPIFDAGLLGEGQVVGVLDTGLDADMCFFREPDGTLPPTVQGFDPGTPDFSRRKVAIVNFLWGAENPADATDWDTQDHGTHVAGSIAGDNLASPGVRDAADGMAPLAKLVVQDGGYGVDDCADMPALGCPAASLEPFFLQAWQQGARIHSNSYGDRENFTPYNIYSDGSADADRFMREHPEFLLVFAAGNNGPGAATVASPATAKNVLAVGATSHGESSSSLASFSSQGPTHDARIKPDVTAPGASVVSANNDGNIGSGNCNTQSMSGTSMACPTAAGLAALAREYFDRGYYPSGAENVADAFAPSAALVKATLIAGAQPMENIASPPPSNEQGWGRVTLDDVLYVAGDRKRLFARDERTGFAATGGLHEESLDVLDGSEPLRVVLAWTDEPSTPAAAINLVNDLDLEAVAPSGTVYRGNVFDAGASQPGGSADRRNNVEVLRIENPEPGAWTIRVRAFALPAPPQDWALVATGRLPVEGIMLERVDLLADDSPGGDADGVLEPGEWIDLVTTLVNSGTDLAANVRVRIASTTPGVTVVQEIAGLPDLASQASAATVAPHPRVRLAAGFTCTTPLVVTLTYEADGFVRSETLTLPTGTESVFLRDDFEGATTWAHVPGESTATRGAWKLGDPQGTEFQPEDDRTPDPGVRGLYTADNSSVGVDDVDDGVVVARSGAYDLSGRPEARVRIARWFANRDRGEDAGDFWRLEIRESATSPDVTLESMGTNESAASWTDVSFRVADYVTPGPDVRLKVSAADGPATGNLIEAAIDEVVFWEPVCDVHDPPPATVETLLVARDASNAVLTWQRPAPTPDRGEAVRYRVHRSQQVSGGFAERGLVEDQSPTPMFEDAGAATATETLFTWLVVAENGAGASEPAP